VYLKPEVTVWVQAGHSYREGKTGLIEAVGSLAEQALLLCRDKAKLDFHNRRVFYIYRNGLGETLQALNQSAEVYMQAADSDLQSSKLAAILLILASALLLVLCLSLAILPTLHSLLKARSEVWSIFLDIPAYILRLLRTKCIERARLFSETSALHFYNFENYKEEAECSVDEEKSALEERKTQREKQVQQSRRLKGLFGKLFPFFVVTLVYFYLIYYTGFEAAGEALTQERRVLNLASRRHHLSRAVNHWILESSLQNRTEGLKWVLPEGQIQSLPLLQAQRLVEELERVEMELVYGTGMLFTGLRSKEHNTLLFANACALQQHRGAEDCYEVADRALAQGLHSALSSYVTLARTLLLRMQHDHDLRADEGDMALLRALDERYLYDALQRSTDLYERDYNSVQTSVQLYQDLLLILYTVFALGFYWVLYRPMVHQVSAN